MNKKQQLIQELTEALAKKTEDADSCVDCGQHFHSNLSRESHYKIYPTHNKQVNEVEATT